MFFLDNRGLLLYNIFNLMRTTIGERKMQNSVLLVAGLCPVCKTKLEYEDAATAVFCPRCGSTVAVGTLLPQSVEDLSPNAEEPAPSGGEGALIFFDRFYRSYPWDRFAVSEELTVAELDRYSASCLSLFPSDPLSYVFNFRRIAVPLIKKLEGLDILGLMIAETRRTLDVERQRELFGKYSSIISRISNQRELILAELRKNVAEAKKYGASNEIINDLFASVDTVEKRISKLKAPLVITDIPAVKSMYDGANNVILAEASALGVDVNEIYDSATAALGEGDIDGALHKLLTVRGFKDSAEIIDEYTGLNSPCPSVITLGKKTYYLKKYTYSEGESYSLYEISDGELGALALDGISSVIAAFGTKLFFIRSSCQLCCFLSEESDLSRNVIIIDSAEDADFKAPSAEERIFLSDRSGFIVEKKLRSEKKRWFLVRLILWIIRLVRRKKKAKINRKNNYSTLLVDMDSGVAKTVVPEAVDVMDIFDDKIFYLSAHNDDSAPSLSYKDVNTDERADILGINHGILGARDGLIIYSEFTHGDCGFSIYTKDAAAPVGGEGSEGEEAAAVVKAPTLLTDNVNEFLGIYDGVILYSIGSEAEKRLYSVKVEGGAPMELSSGYGKLVCVHDGYAYYTVGDGVNTCLYRSSIFGYSRGFIVSCFDTLYKIKDGNILYRDTVGYLCSVSVSSLGNRRIVSGVSGENIVDCGEVIYFIKSESNKNGEEYSSLYSVSPDGSELKKLIHGACNLYEFDGENLLAVSRVTKDYLIKTPISKKDYLDERQSRTVTVYTLVRKRSAERRVLLTLGEPLPGYATYTTRFLIFFKRRKTKATVIIPLYKNPTLSKKHMLDEGAVMAEEERLRAQIKKEKQEEKQRRKAEKIAKKLRKKQAKEEKRLAEEQRLLGL